ncbi:hypothetical protein DCAR_0206216 [Daucus carota subsp. sativus]|uniref:Uncharacterized protein n=1 Tax=Daucus carota subsp. sativus TaxID=79200 RepID=A0AAF0WCI2_DAUCS|nr:hypothetical protein DCAR_0206216 [Daucus carota subsp. sativus]
MLRTDRVVDEMETDHIRMGLGDDFDVMIHNTYGNKTSIGEDGIRRGLNDDAKKFYRLVKEGGQPLYPNCKKFTQLSFIVRLYQVKCIHGFSEAAFTALLELIKEVFPDVNLPSSFSVAKGMIKDLSPGYQKIHACPNDCMLFWAENEKLDKSDKRKFNGKVEVLSAPEMLTGMEVEELLCGYENDFGKKQKKQKGSSSNSPWKKRSIFFELPYWSSNMVRHNLDVMHIEKNLCDKILGTLLNIGGKIWIKAHRYILFNCDNVDIEMLKDEHLQLVQKDWLKEVVRDKENILVELSYQRKGSCQKKQMKTKKQKVVTNHIRRPRTRSTIIASTQVQKLQFTLF